MYEGRHLKFVGLCGGGGNTGPARSRASGQFAELLREFCHDVDTKPVLLTSRVKHSWRCQTRCERQRPLLPLDKAFIDIRVQLASQV